MSLQIDTAKYKAEVERMLTGLLNPAEIAKAYNAVMIKSMHAMRRDWTESVRESYFDKHGVPSRTLTFWKGKDGALEGGKFLVQGPVRDLAYGDTNPKTPGKPTRQGSPPVGARNWMNAQMKILRGNSPQPFLVKFSSGHIAVVRRNRDGKKMRFANRPPGWDRTKLDKLTGPSYPHMYMAILQEGMPEVWETTGHNKERKKNLWVRSIEGVNLQKAFDDGFTLALFQKVKAAGGMVVS